MSLPSKYGYEDYIALINNQAGNGCQTYAMNHILNILKKMEVPYSPDFSIAWALYVSYMAQGGYQSGYSDPHVPSNPAFGISDMFEIVGAVPETLYPSNYDHLGCAGSDNGTDSGKYLGYHPAGWLFNLAPNFEIASTGEEVHFPTIEQVKTDLLQSPLWCNYFISGHCVAIIGYDDNKQEFTFLDSNGYDDSWGVNSGIPGIKHVSYQDFITAMNQNNGWYQTVTNKPTPLIYPYTARIDITHPNGRKNLTIGMGLVNHPTIYENNYMESDRVLLIWDQNNKLTKNIVDPLTRLVIDVPLPDILAEYWPPSQSEPWYVVVSDGDQASDGHIITVNDIKLVDRSKFISGGPLDIYEPNKLPVNVPQKYPRIYIGYPPLVILSTGYDYQNNAVQAVGITGMGFQPGAIASFERIAMLENTAGYDTITINVDSIEVSADSTKITGVIDLRNVAPATFDVTVTNPDGTTCTKPNALTVIAAVPPAPQVDTVSPDTAYYWNPKPVGNLRVWITINGHNFASNDIVKLARDGQPDIGGCYLGVSGQQASIRCAVYIPQGPSFFGKWNVVVTDAYGGVGTLEDGFTITDVPPTIASISPSTAPNSSNNQTFTIIGTGFKQGATVEIVRKHIIPNIPSNTAGSSGNTPGFPGGDVIPGNIPGGSGGHSSASHNVWTLESAYWEKMAIERYSMTISDINPTQITGSINLVDIDPFVKIGKSMYNMPFDVKVQNPDGGVGTLMEGLTVTQGAVTLLSNRHP